MMMYVCGLTVVIAPALLAVITGGSLLLGYRLSERSLGRLTQVLVSCATLAATLLLITMLLTDQVQYTLQLGRWVDLPSEHFHFTFKFLFDRLSIPFVILSLALCGIIGAFASRYLHRDEGYARFFLFYVIFMLGMVLSSIAGTIETMFLGWELVGLSSALLVAFFQNRVNPVANGLRVWTIYRFADGAFLLAALALHHLTGGGDLDLMMGRQPWPENACALEPSQAAGRWFVITRGCRGQIGFGPVLRLVAASHGGTNSLQRDFLWGVISAPGGLSIVACRSHAGAIACFAMDHHCTRRSHRCLRWLGRTRANGCQECLGVCVAHAGKHHRHRDRLRLALPGTDSHCRSCLHAFTAVVACPITVTRSSPTRRQLRTSPCFQPRSSANLRNHTISLMAISIRHGARLPG